MNENQPIENELTQSELPQDELLDRLRKHKTIGAAPLSELAWLAARSHLRHLGPGDVLSAKDAQVEGLYVLLSGHVSLSVDRGSGPQKMIEWRAGDVSGILPYSRLTTPPGDAVALEPTEILSLDRSELPALTHQCYELTSLLVRTMLDRARLFTSSELLNEKMVSLGKLSAGLAHELNNPASAIERHAAQLEGYLETAEAAALALGAARLSDAQLEAVSSIRSACVAKRVQGVLSPLEHADREEAIAEWLSAHALDTRIAYALADTNVSFEELNQLASVVSGSPLNTVLRWAASGCGVRGLASGIQDAAMHISGLVAAVKGFTNMDRAMVADAVDLGLGLSDTVTVLRAKAREKSVAVAVEMEAGLPKVRGFAGELNQIWGNIIENALDAAPRGGHVEITAKREGERVLVRVIDNGTGIAAQIRERIFDPFFTTKPQGQGMGLGLDIARRLVLHNDGVIEVDSQPGRTEFRVALPVA